MKTETALLNVKQRQSVMECVDDDMRGTGREQ